MANNTTDVKFIPPANDGSPANVWPVLATNSQWGRYEPLITSDGLLARYLFGIPLVSRFKDPITGKPFKWTKALLEEQIKLAVNSVELETSLIIMPTKFAQKLPYLRRDFEQFCNLQLDNKPVFAVQSLEIKLADGSIPFIFDPAWLEMSNAVTGQLNLIPLAYSIGIPTQSPGVGTTFNSVYYNYLWGRNWVQAMIHVEYYCGFPDGQLPTVVNDLIGATAAINILSMLSAGNARVNSTSLSIDGLGQSQSGPGAQLYVTRIQDLVALKTTLLKKLQNELGQKFFTGAI